MATAALVLDMLTGFTSGKLANPAAGQIIEPIAALTRAARERDDWLVICGNDAHRPGDFELAVFGGMPWPAARARLSSTSWPRSPAT